MNKRTLSMMLALLTAAGVLSACGDAGTGETKQTNASTTTAAVTNAEEVVEDNGRSGVKDTLPTDLDLGGQTVRFMVRAGDLDTSSEFIAEATNGEIVNDAVYARNLKVEEGLKVNLEYTICEWNYLEIAEGIDQLIMAGDSVYDVVINDVFRLVEASVKGQLHNVAEIHHGDPV